MIRKLYILSGLSILGTILNHTAGWGLIAMFLWTHRYRPVTVPNFDQMGSLPYYLIRLVQQLILYSIPSFLFISGIFIAFATVKTDKTIRGKIVFSRLLLLWVPYLTWSLVSIVGKLLFEDNTYRIVDFFILVVTGGIEGPYYFIPLLTQMYLLSPLLIIAIKARLKWVLFLSAIIQLYAQLLVYPQLGVKLPFVPNDFYIQNWWFPMHIFWFTMGISVGMNIQQFKHWVNRYRWIFLALTVIFFVIGFIEWEFIANKSGWVIFRETVPKSLYALFFILTFLSFKVIPDSLSDRIGELAPNAFGIYLAHVPAQGYVARAIYHITPWMLQNQALFLPVIFV
jgi:hypothetical protein